jgi:hypothetical protein
MEPKSVPKYANVSVTLTGNDGNAFSILARVQRAMKAAGIGEEEVGQFRTEAISGDYDHLLQTVMKWVSTD